MRKQDGVEKDGRRLKEHNEISWPIEKKTKYNPIAMYLLDRFYSFFTESIEPKHIFNSKNAVN